MSSRKPSLSIVQAGATAAQPPRPLGDHGRRVWDRVQAEYRIDDSGGVELLQQICSTVDLIETLVARVAVDGEVIKTRTGLKSHPALRDLLAARSFVSRGLQRLGLNLEPVKQVGRPGSGLGWIPPSS